MNCLFRSRNKNRGLEDRFHHVEKAQQNAHQQAADYSATSSFTPPFQPSTSSFNSNTQPSIAYPYRIQQGHNLLNFLSFVTYNLFLWYCFGCQIEKARLQRKYLIRFIIFITLSNFFPHMCYNCGYFGMMEVYGYN